MRRPPGGPTAQNEFNRDYLNLLDGFPMESTASVLFDKPIDLASVKLFGSPGANLVVFDITNQASPLPVTALTVTTSPAPNGAQSLNFIPAGRVLDPRPPVRRAAVIGGTGTGSRGRASGRP